MGHVRTILLLLIATSWIIGCAASLDPEFETIEESSPTSPPPAAGVLRITSFGGWVGTATSENFQLNWMELTPYNASGSRNVFGLPSTATLSPVVREEE